MSVILSEAEGLVGSRPEDHEIARTWPVELRRELFLVRLGATSMVKTIAG
ncbi:MAG: hypothetical protein ABIL11_02960 [Chloroflexota bacterium]